MDVLVSGVARLASESSSTCAALWEPRSCTGSRCVRDAEVVSIILTGGFQTVSIRATGSFTGNGLSPISQLYVGRIRRFHTNIPTNIHSYSPTT